MAGIVDRLRAAVLPTAFAVALLLLWQALVVVFHYPKVVLPSPSDIFQALAGLSYGATNPGWEASALRLVDILIAGLRVSCG